VLQREIDLVNSLQPGVPEYVATLGKCRYRAGRAREALEHLARARGLYRAAGRDAPPEDLAFTAMALWRLGNRDEAGRSMRELESLINHGDGEGPPSELGSIEEARLLVAGPWNSR